MVGLYNMVPNLLWSIVNLVPISVFCYTRMNLALLFVCIVPGFIPIFLPNSFFDTIQVGKTAATYKKLGVHLVNQFSQNGELVNRLIRKKFPQYKAITFNRTSINRLVQQTYVFEKFHCMMCIFFCLVTIFAVSKKNFTWAAIITVTNILYNIYPNLLQQYIRLKLSFYHTKEKATARRS